MQPKPPRPQPTEKILDYDDGDPYSCIAAGNAEDKLQRDLQQRVADCFTNPRGSLELLARLDLASVKTALYDIWNEGRDNRAPIATWAAEQYANLGDDALIRYDRAERG